MAKYFVPSKKPRVVIYVTEDVKRQLEDLAEQKGRTVSNMVNFWLKKILDGRGATKED